MILEFGQPDKSAIIAVDATADSEGVEPALTRWDGAMLQQALIHLQSEFAKVAPSIDAINVFPVADGDTGINMLATISAATQAAGSVSRTSDPSSAPAAAQAVLAAAARGAIDGARGNSGVILSQFFEGLASVASGESLDAPSLSRGLVAAARAARMAVALPVEGTIITVMEAAAAAVTRIDPQRLTIGAVFELAAQSAAEALMHTPGQLPVLAHAGVVDAGGYGFVAILETLRQFAYEEYEAELGGPPRHRQPERSVGDAKSRNHGTNRAGLHSHGGVPAACIASERPSYCINFMLRPCEFTADAVRDRLAPLGDSLVVVGTHDRLRVHLHSTAVEQVEAEARQLGSLSGLQVDEIIERVELAAAGDSPARSPSLDDLGRSRRKRLLSLACARGDGLEQALREMGATSVLPIPRTTMELTCLKSAICSLMRTGADVVLLPNDAALIVSLRELIRVDESGSLHLIETESVPQGIAALSALQPDLEVSQNLSLMRSASLGVKTLVVVSALLTAEESGALRDAHFRGLIDGDVVICGIDPAAVLVELIAASEPDDDQLLSIFYGRSVGSEMLETVEREVRERFPALAIELLAGGQDDETFIAALE